MLAPLPYACGEQDEKGRIVRSISDVVALWPSEVGVATIVLSLQDLIENLFAVYEQKKGVS